MKSFGWLGRARSRRRRLESGERDGRLRAALRAFVEGNERAAEHELLESLRLDSNDVDLYLVFGAWLRRSHQIDRAIRVHQNLLLRSDLTSEARFGVELALARDFLAGGFFERAATGFEAALEHEPRSREALSGLAQTCERQADFEGAIAALGRMRASDRDAREIARLRVAQARAAHHQGLEREAKRALKRALQLDPRRFDALMLLGEIEAQRGRNRAALGAWRAAASASEDWTPELYSKLASAFAALGQPREFEAFVRERLSSHPSDAASRRELAAALASRGCEDEAAAEYERASAAAPEDAGAVIEHATFLLEHKRAEGALALLRGFRAQQDRRSGAQP